MVRSRPGLVLTQAMLEVHRGQFDTVEVERLLEHADRAVDRQPEPEQPPVPTDAGMVSRVPTAIALLRSELAAGRGDAEQTARFSRTALTHISGQERGPRLWARWLLALADAPTLAAPEGHLRVFVDEGAPMATLLGKLLTTPQAVAAQVPPAFLDRLLEAFEQAGQAVLPRSRRGAALPGLSRHSAPGNWRCSAAGRRKATR